MNKKNLLLLLVPLVLGACHHERYESARVYTLPPQQGVYYRPAVKPVKPHRKPPLKKYKLPRRTEPSHRVYDTQNRTYADKYVSPPPRPVPLGSWQGMPLRQPQMPGYAAR